MRPIVGALKFFFRVTVPRPWSTLQALRLPKSNTLPQVLLPQRCWQLIDATKTSHLQTVFRAMYTCGLRGVDVHLRPQDIDADRMILRVCTTKGHYQREVGVKETGFTSVLHTWGRDLTYHPHVHVLIPAGGIDSEGLWRSSRSTLFVPEQILEQLFRGKLESKLENEPGFDSIPAAVWRGRFVVDSQPVGSGQAALAYLAPYISRGAVADWRVTDFEESKSLDNAMLTLQVKRSGTSHYQSMPMRVEEFIRRWLHHVLPQGFHRVRHYGFVNSRAKRSIDEVRWLVAVALECLYLLAYTQQIVMADPLPMQCPSCGGVMVCAGYIPAAQSPQPMIWSQRAPP
jgi:hypothetical protein